MNRLGLILKSLRVGPAWFTGAFICYLLIGCITVAQVLIIVVASQYVAVSGVGERSSELVFAGCLYLALPLLNQTVLAVGTFWVSKLQRGLGIALRRWFGDLLLSADQESLERPSFQNQISWLMTDLVNKPGSFLQATFNCISPAVSGIALVLFMGRTSVWVTVSVIFVSLVSFWNQHWYSRYLLLFQNQLNWIRREGSYWLSQIMSPTASTELKLLNWDREVLKRSKTKFLELDNLELKLQRKNLYRNLCINLVGAILIGVSGWKALGAAFSAENSAALMSLLIGSAVVIRSINQLGVAVSTAMSEGEAATQVLSLAGKMTESIRGSDECKESSGNAERRIHSLQAESISYYYPSSSEPVFEKISFQIFPGQLVIVKGANGAGKTTLLEVMAGFRVPTDGKIIRTGIDNRNCRLLRQVPLRLETSLKENVNLTSLSEDNTVHLDERLPLAVYETLSRWIEELSNDVGRSSDWAQEVKLGSLTPQSINLSGGQWQRLGIIRTFSQLSSIYILDEPSSNLDSIHTYELMRMIRVLSRKALVVVTSHDPEMEAMADEVIAIGSARYQGI